MFSAGPLCQSSTRTRSRRWSAISGFSLNLFAAAIWLLVSLEPAPSAGRQPIFEEVPPHESGVTFVHHNGFSPQRYLPETTGAGIAIFDYNNDGWPDILFVDSGSSPFYTPEKPLHPVLYRNNGNGTYTDVSVQAGLTADLFGQGVAVADYDGDGHEDIFITGFGKCVLYHNNGNGTFTDVTAASGIRPPQWGTSAVWFDFDNDGKLDLFVGEFADYSSLRTCSAAESYGGGMASAESNQKFFYCNPKILKPRASHLYRNLGSGKFADVSDNTGISARSGKLWGAVATDINNDGYLDLFVSNDTAPNFLWVNRSGKKFEEIGIEAGVGFSADGSARSGMGVDAGDFDRDGWQDLVVGNIDSQTASLYRNIGQEMFDDVNLRTGLSQATRMLSSWGLSFFDYDNDGWPDLIISNGHPDDSVESRNPGITYRQPLVLMHNLAGKRMENVAQEEGRAFSKKYSARGLAVCDLNNDGYPDVVFTENGGPAHILMNTARSSNHWLGLKLRGKVANPEAVGATIRWSVAGHVLSRFKRGGGSFLSSQDQREILAAGKSQIDWVEIKWPLPSHSIDRIVRPAMDRYLNIIEGEASSAK